MGFSGMVSGALWPGAPQADGPALRMVTDRVRKKTGDGPKAAPDREDQL